MVYERRQKKPTSIGLRSRNLLLVATGGLHVGEEKEEAQHDQRRVVGHEDRPCYEDKMRERDLEWDGAGGGFG